MRLICPMATSVLALLLHGVAFGQDVLVFWNGDRLTGSVNRIERGVVYFSASAIDGDSEIGWNRIKTIESEREFLFQMFDGRRMTGHFGTSSEADGDDTRLVVSTRSGTARVNHSDVTYIAKTIGQRGGRLEVDVGAGFSFAKSNSQTQMNAHGDLEYEAAGYSVRAGLSSIFSTQRGALNNTNRQNINGVFLKILSPRWGVVTFGDYLKSEEQRLDRRVVVGGGPSRTLVHGNRFDVRVFGGAVWNNEVFSPDLQRTPVTNQVEGLAGVWFTYFHFKQATLDSSLTVFPGITDRGRIRMDWNSRLRLRLVPGQPLWWNISQSVNLDSRPPAATPGSDFVTTTSISWVFP